MAIDAGGERRPGTVDGRLQAMARDYGGDEREVEEEPDGDLSVRRGGGGIRSHSYYFYLTAPT